MSSHGITYRTDGTWGFGIGRNLTPAEVDLNFYDHDGRIESLETNPPVAVSISAINMVGASMTVFLDDSTELGPFTLPTAEFDWRGNWAAGTSYFINDVFYVAGDGAFIVTADFESASAFDPGGAEIQRLTADGADGTTGAAGADGADGTNGTDGATWFTGAGAPAGGLGAENDLYLNTANGDVYKHQGTSGWGVVANVEGPAGTSEWFVGSGAPSAGLGGESDLYLNTANGDVYQHQGTTGWVVVDNITGPAMTSLDDAGDVEYGSPGPEDGDVMTWAGSPGAWEPQAPGSPALLHVRDEKTNGTAGGTSNTGSVHTRDLNTVKTNEIAGAALASNQITLAAGTYEIDATTPALRSGDHKAYLYDTTGAADLVVGANAWAGAQADSGQTRAIVKGRFTISVESVLELRHWIAVGRTSNGLGNTTGDTKVEVYAEVLIRQIS